MSALPEVASHSYLGVRLCDFSSSSDFLAGGDVCEVVLLPLLDVVLFPGETLPLRVQDPVLKPIVARMLSPQYSGNRYRIGVVHQRRPLDLLTWSSSLAEVATIVLIRAANDTSQSDGDLVVMGKGKYRARLLSVFIRRGVLMAKAEVLSDAPLHRAKLRPCVNYVPNWAYKACSAEALARQVFDLAAHVVTTQEYLGPVWTRWGPSSHQDRYGAEDDPVAFSFFIAANIPAGEKALRSLLLAPTVVDRLRMERQLLRDGRDKRLGCASCGHPIASKTALFNVPGAEGVAGAYVNPHGIVHHTVTVHALLPNASTRLQGYPSTQDSWFPGYAWTILNCGYCFHHLGWRFTLASHPTPRPYGLPVEPQRGGFMEALMMSFSNLEDMGAVGATTLGHSLAALIRGGPADDMQFGVASRTVSSVPEDDEDREEMVVADEESEEEEEAEEEEEGNDEEEVDEEEENDDDDIWEDVDSEDESYLMVNEPPPSTPSASGPRLQVFW